MVILKFGRDVGIGGWFGASRDVCETSTCAVSIVIQPESSVSSVCDFPWTPSSVAVGSTCGRDSGVVVKGVSTSVLSEEETVKGLAGT